MKKKLLINTNKLDDFSCFKKITYKLHESKFQNTQNTSMLILCALESQNKKDETIELHYVNNTHPPPLPLTPHIKKENLVHIELNFNHKLKIIRN
jgi:hypothetical protein